MGSTNSASVADVRLGLVAGPVVVHRLGLMSRGPDAKDDSRHPPEVTLPGWVVRLGEGAPLA
jgi:hypothetical protein